MNARARQLLDELLQLSSEDRALIADELEASLEEDRPPQEVEKAWAKEIMRRVRNIREGRSRGRDAFQALAEIRARLATTKR